MRKLIAIGMLTVLMFNMGGYFILYQVLERKAEISMRTKVSDGALSAADQVEFKLSFEMPYPVYEQKIELESPDRVKADDQTFSITSHEYSNNKLTIVGVRDQWAMHVDAVMAAFNRAANGDASDSDILHGLQNLLQAFVSDDAVSLVHSNSWQRIVEPVDYTQLFASLDQPSTSRPPSI